MPIRKVKQHLDSCRVCRDWYVRDRYKNGMGFCSTRCVVRSRASVLQRFVSMFKYGESSCWMWQALKDRDGYGVLPRSDGNLRATRLSLNVFKGIGGETYGEACHTCDTPSCVNPDHLYPGTRRSNADDMVNRGRQIQGLAHHKSKLSIDNVVEIRNRTKAGESQHALAREFRVTQANVNAIHLRKSWKSIP